MNFWYPNHTARASTYSALCAFLRLRKGTAGETRIPLDDDEGASLISSAFEDIRIGATSTTQWRTITESYVQDFAELTWDRHPVHLDSDYAEHTRFGRRIAHGALMLSTLLGLVELNPRYLQCFYGLDQVRFHAPTYFGDAVQAVTKVVAVRPRSDGETAVVTCSGALVNKSGTTIVSGMFEFLVAGHAQAMDMNKVSHSN